MLFTATPPDETSFAAEAAIPSLSHTTSRRSNLSQPKWGKNVRGVNSNVESKVRGFLRHFLLEQTIVRKCTNREAPPPEN